MNTKRTTFDFFDWAMSENVNWTVRFHNEIRRCMHIVLDEMKEREKDEKQIKWIEEVYINNFDNRLTINCFLMHYSFLEEFLYHCYFRLKFKRENLKGSSIKKYKDVFEVIFPQYQNSVEWVTVTDSEKIRNCLMHTNARVSLSRDKDWLEFIVINKPEFFNKKLDRINLTKEYLKYYTEFLQNLVENVSKGVSEKLESDKGNIAPAEVDIAPTENKECT